VPVLRRFSAGLVCALALATAGVAAPTEVAAGEPAPPIARVAAKGGKKPAGKAGPRGSTPAVGRRNVQAPAARAPLTIDLPLATRHLAGGVLVIAIPSATAQVIAVTVAEGAGASSDPADRGGLASLRARLGGTRASAERRPALVAERGGEVSIRVGAEDVLTTYVLPTGELALPLWLESDRLLARVSEETLVGSLRAMTEARERDPAARHRSALDALIYSGFAPYAHDPDGKADELLAIRNDAVAGTLAPRPTRPVVVVITGAISAESALLAADHELAGIAARPSPALAGALPDQTNQREAAVTDARARTATLWLGFAIPTAATADHAALEIAAALVANAPRSRLERALIDEGIARAAHAEIDPRRGPSELRIEVDLAPGADPVRAREVTERALLELGKSSPPPDELRRAVAWLVAERVATLSDPASLATFVARAALREPDTFSGPTGSVRADLHRWSAIAGDAVTRAVATHLSPIRRNVVEVKPERPLEALARPSFPKAAPKRGASGSAAKPQQDPKKALPPLGSKPGPVGKPAPAKAAPGKAAPSKPPREARPAKKRGKP